MKTSGIYLGYSNMSSIVAQLYNKELCINKLCM